MYTQPIFLAEGPIRRESRQAIRETMEIDAERRRTERNVVLSFLVFCPSFSLLSICSSLILPVLSLSLSLSLSLTSLYLLSTFSSSVSLSILNQYYRCSPHIRHTLICLWVWKYSRFHRSVTHSLNQLISTMV